MTLLLAGLWACTEPAPKPASNRFEDLTEAPKPTPAPAPAPEGANDDTPASPEPAEVEPDDTDAGGVQLGHAGPIPGLTDAEKSDYRKRGTLTNVSQPRMLEPLITPDQCEDLTDGGPLKGGDSCVTAVVECDSRTIGHTVGGIDLYTSRFYEKKQCWPATKNHDSGNERVYKLVMPEGEWRAWATLYTPCADLDIAAVRHDFGGCPTLASNVGPCEMSVQNGFYAERIELTTQTKRAGERPVWYIIVEGKDDAEGMFELDIQCRPGVGGPVDP
ncbi:MAG: hypothetical protein H6737_08790 [Alphaproteobacteria bacterium]|nr:hypothetical protein [Alphaproteobacteria bacterium]